MIRAFIFQFIQKINRYIFFVLASLLIAFFIVWEPVYFFLLLAAVLSLIIFFWKTGESLIFLVLYLPFQVALNISGDIDLASSRVMIVTLFLAWFTKSLAKKRLEIANKPTTWLLLIFLILILFSVLFSIDQERSAVRSLFFLSILPLYFVSIAYLDSLAKITKVVYVLLLSASLAGLAGIIQFLCQFLFGIDAIMNFWSKNIAYLFYGQSFGKIIITNPSWLVNINGETFFRAISFFPDPHMFSFYLGMAAPMALSLVIFSDTFDLSKRQKLLLYICNAILFLALGLTFSRAGYFGAFFGVISIVLLGWKFFTRNIKLVITAAFLLISVLIFSSSSLIISRFISSFDPSEGSNLERLINWNQSIKIIGDSPFYGVGVGSYAEALNARAPLRSSVTAHNTYLDIAAEIGIPALIVWIIMLVLTVINLISIFKSKGLQLSKEKVISLGLAGTFIWFSSQMIFDTAIYSPTLLSMLMVYLGISVNLRRESVKSFIV
jgi:putative inorganic carbon (HCO3(-)) transporter